MDSSRSHDARMMRTAQPGTYPYGAEARSEGGQQPAPRRTSPSVYPYEQPRATSSSTYPYEQQAPQQPAPQQHTPQQAQQHRPAGAPKKASRPRRMLGVLAFLALTLASTPIHIAAVFFVYVTFESPGDAITAVLIVSASFIGSFAALFVTGLVAQLVGAFPGRWRARVTFAVLSGVLALGGAYLAALVAF